MKNSAFSDFHQIHINAPNWIREVKTRTGVHLVLSYHIPELRSEPLIFNMRLIKYTGFTHFNGQDQLKYTCSAWHWMEIYSTYVICYTDKRGKAVTFDITKSLQDRWVYASRFLR